MSFSVGCRHCGLEYSGRRPSAVRAMRPTPASSRSCGRSGAGCAAPVPRWSGPTARSAPWRSTSTGTATRSGSAAISSSRSAPHSGRRRRATRSSSRPPTRSGSSTTTACSGSGGSVGGRSPAAAQYVDAIDGRLDGRLHLGARRPLDAPPRGQRRAAARGRRGAGFRRRRGRDPRRPGTRLLEDPTPAERRLLGAFAYTRERGRPPYRRVVPAAPCPRPARSWNYRPRLRCDDGRRR